MHAVNAGLCSFHYACTGAIKLIHHELPCQRKNTGHERFTAWPQNEHSQWKLHLRDTGEKAKQNSAKITQNLANVFSFYAITEIKQFFNVLPFTRSF